MSKDEPAPPPSPADLPHTTEHSGISLSPRRVALFCTNFLPYSQVFVYEQLRQYQRYAADVFAWRRFNPQAFPFPRVHVAEPGYVVRGKSRRFERAFAGEHFHVVHAHFGPAGVYAHRYAQPRRLPLIVTFHGYDVPLLGSHRRFLPLHLPYALGSRAMLDGLAMGLCASLELKRMLIDLGVSEARLRVHRLGIDLSRFKVGPVPRERLVVMIGRFVEKKGFEYGLQAFALAAARLRDARLVLVGEGERRRALERLARELGVRERVEFAGVLSQERIAELLGRAAVLLAPSVVARDGNRESGLIVVKEASASGAVPIGTEHGGIPESIDSGRTGFLVAERDYMGMGVCLSNLLENSALREQMAIEGRRKMEREFDNQRLVAQLEEIYDEVGRG
jgi:colanic acid/amylovoran biosynthesis glycosyltransferase